MRRSNQQGMTLLEILLVFAIMAAMLLLAVRQYQASQSEQNAQQVKKNIDTLFQSMAHYYQANCRDRHKADGSLDTSSNGKGALSPSTLNPYPPKDTDYQVVSITTLQSGGFLAAGIPVASPLVQSYSLQFNPVISTRSIYTCCPVGKPEEIDKANTLVIWRIQIAVLLNAAYDPETYQKLLGADCLSDTGNNNAILPCEENKTGAYLVWERLPGAASGRATSSLWSMMPIVKQFTQQYTNDDYYSYEMDNTTWNKKVYYENYLCGG